MTQFTTLTELQILNAAYDTYLASYLREKERYDALPNNALTRARYERAKARVDELHAAILKLENA